MKMKIITTHVIHPFSGENYFFFSFSRDFFLKKIEIICIIQASSQVSYSRFPSALLLNICLNVIILYIHIMYVLSF